MMEAQLIYDAKAELGEGPLWLPSTHELLWVDINKGEVHSLNTISLQDTIIYKGHRTSCVVMVSEEELMIADTDELILFNRMSNTSTLFLQLDFNVPNVRFNDGKVDPYGRLWIGTMEMNVRPNKGNLYRINENKEVALMISEVTISNGIAWSLDHKTMYYIDTVDQVVYAYDFNEQSEISNRRIVVRIPTEKGAPDGMTIDEQGNLWVAMWGGHAVLCFDPNTGLQLQEIKLTVPHITSCTFGGTHNKTLYITSARTDISEEKLKEYPSSGGLFSIDLPFHGVIENQFIIK